MSLSKSTATAAAMGAAGALALVFAASYLKKDSTPESLPPAAERYLIFGKNGWIGQKIIAMLKAQGKEIHLASCRTYDRESVAAELDLYRPTHVINAAGVTGRPNVDWCESNQAETIRSNVIGTLNVSDLCEERGIHCTLYATGCIFEYDADHAMGSGKGFLETDKANFDGSFYSKTKGYLEEMLKSYTTTLILRLRMPISDDLSPRNFVTKIVRYDRVINIPNSMSILADLLPASLKMAEAGLVGIYNFTNPGAISHNEVLDIYTEIIDPNFKYENFTIEEQDKILASRRSNNELDTTKLTSALKQLGVTVPEIHEGYRMCFQRMKANLVAQHGPNYFAFLPKKLSASKK